MARTPSTPSLTYHPLTPDRWPDLERLFGTRGACGGCWCMVWRQTRSDYERRKGAANKRAFRRIVNAGPPPGLLAYADGEPIGWCAVAPREDYPTLDRSRVLKRVDERPVWSVVCFFIAKPFRGRGVSTALLRQAVAFVRRRGGRIVEGYPVEPEGQWPAAFAWTGLASAFRNAGFAEVARRSPTRPIMRHQIGQKRRMPAEA